MIRCDVGIQEIYECGSNDKQGDKFADVFFQRLHNCSQHAQNEESEKTVQMKYFSCIKRRKHRVFHFSELLGLWRSHFGD